MNLKQIKIVDRMDHTLKSPTESDFEALLSGLGAELLAEPTTLADIDETLNGHALVTDSMLLSAITTRRMRLANTMKALVKTLNQNTDPAKGLIAGVTEGMEVDSQFAVLGGAILSKPRKSGLIATMTAEIPFSDGQSVFIIFHAPDDDPAVIGPDDTLIAFRFLLNKRDITDIVAPHNGRDISLKQTALAITRIVERNSNRFRASLRVKADQQKDIETLQSQLDATIAATGDISSQADAKQAEIDAMQSSLDALRARIASQNAVNADLEKALPAAPAVPQPAVAANDDAPAERLEPKYAGNFTGEKHQSTRDLKLSEINKLIRVAITEGRKAGKYPAELRVAVTSASRNEVSLEIVRLPADYKVFSQEQIEEFVGGQTQYLPDSYSTQMRNLMTQLKDEANEFNRDRSDSMVDYFERRFYETVSIDYDLAEEFKAREVAAYRAAQSANSGLPQPSAYRDGSETMPIEIEATEKDLAALGTAEIVSIGDENIYMKKDGLTYYSKVQSTDHYTVGLWDFAENPMGVAPVAPAVETKPAYEMTRDAWIRQQIETSQYAAEYLADEALYNGKAQMLESDWVDFLKDRAKVGRISDEALNDYVRIYGTSALVSVFRGEYAPGIEGFIPAQPGSEPEDPRQTFSEFLDTLTLEQAKAWDAQDEKFSYIVDTYDKATNPDGTSNIPRVEAIEDRFTQLLNAEAQNPATPEPAAADPTAGISPELLEVQRDIDAMEKQQERMKQANAIFRKYQKAKEKDPVTAKEKATAELVAIGYPSTFIDTLRPNFLGNLIPHEGFELTNLNARLKSRRARLEELQQREEAAAEGDLDLDLTFNGAPVNVEVDYGDDRIRVYFPNLKRRATADDPEYAAVQRISSGANWSPTNRAWQRKITRNAKADIAYSLGFKSWDEMVKAGKSAGQDAAPTADQSVDYGTPIADLKAASTDELKARQTELIKLFNEINKRGLYTSATALAEEDAISDELEIRLKQERNKDQAAIEEFFGEGYNPHRRLEEYGYKAVGDEFVKPGFPNARIEPGKKRHSFGGGEEMNGFWIRVDEFEPEVEALLKQAAAVSGNTIENTKDKYRESVQTFGKKEAFKLLNTTIEKYSAAPAVEQSSAPEVQSEITALQSVLTNTQSADELIDALDQALAVLDSAGEEQYAELIEQASNRITELLEAQ